MKTIIITILLLSSFYTNAFAVDEHFAKATCKAATSSYGSLQDYVTVYFYINSTQGYPNAVELIQQYPTRYEKMMSMCRPSSTSAGERHLATMDYIKMSSTLVRANNLPCRTNSQCTSGYCSTSLGSCQSSTVQTSK